MNKLFKRRKILLAIMVKMLCKEFTDITMLLVPITEINQTITNKLAQYGTTVNSPVLVSHAV